MIETQTTIDVHTTSSVEEQMKRFPGEGKPSGYYEVDEEELMKYEPDVDEHECPICCECGCESEECDLEIERQEYMAEYWADF